MGRRCSPTGDGAHSHKDPCGRRSARAGGGRVTFVGNPTYLDGMGRQTKRGGIKTKPRCAARNASRPNSPGRLPSRQKVSEHMSDASKSGANQAILIHSEHDGGAPNVSRQVETLDNFVLDLVAISAARRTTARGGMRWRGSIALGRAIAPVSAGAADITAGAAEPSPRPTSHVGSPPDEGRADGSPPVAQQLETPTFIFRLSPFVARRKRGARPVPQGPSLCPEKHKAGHEAYAIDYRPRSRDAADATGAWAGDARTSDASAAGGRFILFQSRPSGTGRKGGGSEAEREGAAKRRRMASLQTSKKGNV